MLAAPTLRLGCHNVNGLEGKYESLLALWAALRLDVVVATDTHAALFERTRLEHRLQARGWHSF